MFQQYLLINSKGGSDKDLKRLLEELHKYAVINNLSDLRVAYLLRHTLTISAKTWYETQSHEIKYTEPVAELCENFMKR